MPARRLGSRVAPLLLGLAACGDRPLDFVAWPALSAEWGLLLATSPEGPVRMEGLQALHPSPPEVQVSLGESEALYLIALSEARLRSLDPRLRLEAGARVELSPLPESCPGGVLSGPDRIVPLGRAAEAVLELESERWTARELPAPLQPVGLSVPRSSERSCDGGERAELRPFLSEPLAPPGPVVIEGVTRDPADPDARWCHFSARALAWLDESRLAVVTECDFIYRHREGEPFEASLPHRARLPEPADVSELRTWVVRSVAATPGTSSTGADRLLVSWVELDDRGRHHRGALARATLGPGGEVSSETLFLSEAGAGAVQFGAGEEFVASLGDGSVLLGTFGDGVLERLELDAERVEEAYAWLERGQDEAGPYWALSSEEGSVFLLRWTPGRAPLATPLSPPNKFSTTRGFALVDRGAQGAEAWMATDLDGLVRRPLDPAGVWAKVSLGAPPGAESCAAPTAACGERPVQDSLAGLGQLGAGGLLVGPSSCSAAVLLHLESGCTDLVAPTFEPVARVERRSRFDRAARSRGGRVAFLSRDLLLLVGARPDARGP